jgi:hypothetical protein
LRRIWLFSANKIKNSEAKGDFPYRLKDLVIKDQIKKKDKQED